jgi:hypothetical protein
LALHRIATGGGVFDNYSEILGYVLVTWNLQSCEKLSAIQERVCSGLPYNKQVLASSIRLHFSEPGLVKYNSAPLNKTTNHYLNPRTFHVTNLTTLQDANV